MLNVAYTYTYYNNQSNKTVKRYKHMTEIHLIQLTQEHLSEIHGSTVRIHTYVPHIHSLVIVALTGSTQGMTEVI